MDNSGQAEVGTMKPEPVGQGWLGIGCVVDRMPDAVIQIGVNGIVEAASRAVDTIFGWAPDELVGQPITVIMGPTERQAHQSFIERYLETGSSGILRAAPRTLSGLHRSGRRVEFELTIGETWVAEERKFIGVCREAGERVALEGQRREALDALRVTVGELETARNELLAAQMRERRRAAEAVELGRRATDALAAAEQALGDLKFERASNSRREAFYQTIVEIMPAFLVVKDARDGSFVLINPAAKDALGLDPGTCIGRTVADIFPGEEAEASAAEDRLVIESRSVVLDQAAPITIASGELKYYSTKKVAVFAEDRPTYIVTAGQDVTEQVEAQNSLKLALNVAERANAAKSQFLANMSHELRTPLNGIIAMADMLHGAQADDRTRQMAATIVESGRVLEHVINDILDVAKIEAGQMKLELRPFDLNSVLAGVFRLHSAAAAARGIRLESVIDPAALGTYMGDGTRIGQVVSNLLSNAVKFTERGVVQLSVRRSRNGLRVRVRDTGPGFDRVTAKRLFDRFEQADVSVSRRHGGTGLGLAICRSFAEMMGGRISVRSVSGVGSLFVVTLPLERAAERQDAHDQSAPIVSMVQGEAPNMRVLLADDHEVNRRVVAMILEPLGVDLILVENGQAAVDAATVSPFDLILMDVQMPVMDGLTATRHIREHERVRSLARTPIISLTANAMPDDVERSLAAGSDLHVPKPIRPADLVKAISSLTARAG
jgi:PAS domain S-box-containing protein